MKQPVALVAGAFCIFVAIVCLVAETNNLERRIAVMEANMFPPVRGLPGRTGGMENGVFGSYSGNYPGVFVPFKTQPVKREPC